MKINSEMLDKVSKVIYTISENMYLKSVSKGMVATIPFTIAGSIVVLLKTIPFAFWQNFLTTSGMIEVSNIILQLTTNMLAVWVVFFIASNLGKRFDQDPVITGSICLLSFLILTPIGVNDKVKFLSFDWLGAKGMFMAIIVALIIGRFYIFLMQKKVYIRMPDSVPPFVEKSFAAVIPFFVISLLCGIIAVLFRNTDYGTIHQLVYNIVQMPLQNIGGSFGGVVVAYLAMNLLWFFGIHGKAVVYSVVAPIWSAYTAANIAATAAGEASVHIIDMGFTTIFMEIGGAGCCLALCILMLAGKSKQYASMGKIFAIPTFCGINEPITFGTPLVLNFAFLIPTILAPIVSGGIGYLAIKFGIIPMLGGIQVPTGTPFLLNAFLIGGVPSMLCQIVCLFACIAVYLPFFLIADRKAYAEEQKNTVEETTQASEQTVSFSEKAVGEPV